MAKKPLSNFQQLTTSSREIVKTLSQSSDPLSVKELTQISPLLSKINKTTLYRNLELLITREVVRPVMVNATATYYELASLSHHHHAVCMQCLKIMDVPCSQEQPHILQTRAKGFQTKDTDIIYHGLCAKCQ